MGKKRKFIPTLRVKTLQENLFQHYKKILDTLQKPSDFIWRTGTPCGFYLKTLERDLILSKGYKLFFFSKNDIEKKDIERGKNYLIL